MKEEFVTYDQAVALKELGFDIPVNASWIINKMYPQGIIGFGSWQNSNLSDNHLSAPLKQQVFRWFREKHNLHGFHGYYPNVKKWYSTCVNLEWTGKDYLINMKSEDRSVKYDTSEEAESACIDKLIEIVKNK